MCMKLRFIYMHCNKVVQHVACVNHTFECKNHTQQVKITFVLCVV
jgi:hypothetical protein